ncbi:MAG: MAPEG family protein [Pseudomonadota bacterium]
MTTELTLLGWTLVLALVHIVIAASLRTMETGLSFGFSSRDGQAPPVGKLTARVQRAQANLFETLPLFAIAVLIAHVAGRTNSSTLLGCELFLAARVLYLPLYAFGVPMVRSIAWGGAMLGLVMVLKGILAGA